MMIVKMEVEFGWDEVGEIVKAEYIRLFGPPLDSYELETSHLYGAVKVYTIKKTPPIPIPPKEETKSYVTELLVDHTILPTP